MNTREQCLKWAKEAVVEPEPIAQDERFHLSDTEMVALCQRVWNEALEEVASNLEHGAFVGEYVEAIRNLKVKP